MKRMVVFIGIALFVISFAKIAAAAGTGPIEPLGNMKSEITAEYNGIFDKDLDKSGAIAKGQVEESTQAYAKYALGLSDYLNIYMANWALQIMKKKYHGILPKATEFIRLSLETAFFWNRRQWVV